MSMIAEMENAREAREFKAMLLDAAEGGTWGDVRSVVKAFARVHILPKYIVCCGDSIGLEEVDNRIIELFNK